MEEKNYMFFMPKVILAFFSLLHCNDHNRIISEFMNKQYLVVLIYAMGLMSCGGGGGSSGTDSGSDPTNQGPADALVGTWVQIDKLYEEDGSLIRWVRTDWKTIVVEKIGSELKFTNCVSGESLNGTVSGDEITFPVQPNLDEAFNLQVITFDSLVTSIFNAESSIRTRVELHKTNSGTTNEIGNANLTVKIENVSPQTLSSWNQFCVETLTYPSSYIVKIKGKTTVSGSPATVTMKLESDSRLASDTFVYPGNRLDITGGFDFSASGLSSELYSPTSGIVVSTSSADFNISELIMPSELGLDTEISGTIHINPILLSGP